MDLGHCDVKAIRDSYKILTVASAPPFNFVVKEKRAAANTTKAVAATKSLHFKIIRNKYSEVLIALLSLCPPTHI